ncbi:MAG: sulfite exporter TauE/SafE family protein [Myxococcales bacterium]|nr:sulfite exporter TauE/SafE family protein [Myxococcales bacterium]
MHAETIAPLTAFTVALLGGAAGSGHCIGMCGPFAGFQGMRRFGRRFGAGQLAYHGGRLTTYIALGTVAGLAGEALSQVAGMLDLQRVLGVAMGLLLVVVGISYLIGPRSTGKFGQAWARVVGKLVAVGRSGGPITGPYLLGLTSTLLPCGFLYTFALAGAATGSLAGSLATMAGFWLGTAPALAAAAFLARYFRNGPMRHARKLVGVALIVMGVIGVVGRWGHAPAEDGKPQCCHHDEAG